MAKQPSVHVERRDDGWAVIREGTQRATSVYPTQAEAAKEGRHIARRDRTEFFLHAQDGKIREHSSYGEGTPSETADAAGQSQKTADAGTKGARVARRAPEAAGHATQGGEEDAGREEDRAGRVVGVARSDETSSDKTDGTEEGGPVAKQRDDYPLASLEERYAGYEVYDVNGERIGKIGYLFVNENHELEYVGVKMGSLGTRSTLIPMDVVRTDDRRRRMEVSRSMRMVKEGPSFVEDQHITPELEELVRGHYELRTLRSSGRARGKTGTDRVGGADPFGELKNTSEEYSIYDSHYERIGRVDDVVLGDDDRVSYIGVKTGLFGTNSTLIPVEIVRVNDKRRLIEISETKETISHAPHFGQDEDVTPDLEDRVRSYFGLEPLLPSHEPEVSYPSVASGGTPFGPDERVDLEPGERARAQEEQRLRAPERLEENVPQGSAPEAAGGEEPVSRRAPAGTQSPWERTTSESGVTVHRRRR
jgi:sporulation protein YlmC with PRC-barrel domain